MDQPDEQVRSRAAQTKVSAGKGSGGGFDIPGPADDAFYVFLIGLAIIAIWLLIRQVVSLAKLTRRRPHVGLPVIAIIAVLGYGGGHALLTWSKTRGQVSQRTTNVTLPITTTFRTDTTSTTPSIFTLGDSFHVAETVLLCYSGPPGTTMVAGIINPAQSYTLVSQDAGGYRVCRVVLETMVGQYELTLKIRNASGKVVGHAAGHFVVVPRQ